MTSPSPKLSHRGEEGYLLLWLVVVCFLILLALGVAAPRVAKQLERDREIESEHRALEYVRAIQLYYRKNNAYPTSLDQLLGSGTTGTLSALNVKYLRQQYKDPLTRGDFRLIHLGEAKTEVKSFFGEPLQGVAPGLGAAAGSQSNLTGGSNFNSPGPGFSSGAAGTPGAPNTSTSTAPGAAGIGSAAGTASNTTTGPATQTPTGTGTPPGTGTTGSSGFGGTGTSATSFQGSKGGIVGVGSNAKGHGLIEWNGSENIEDWEFLYDPRVELLKAKVSLFGGTPAASGSGSLGSGFGSPAGASGIGTPPAGFGSPASSPGSPASSPGTPAPGSGTPAQPGTTGPQ